MLKIIDCIVESDVQEDGVLLTPKKKHLEDRTSNKQTVLNQETEFIDEKEK